jgi:hypothetical protein
MSEFHTQANLPALSKLLKQLQDLDPATRLESHHAMYDPRIHVPHNDIHRNLREIEELRRELERQRLVVERRRLWRQRVLDTYGGQHTVTHIQPQTHTYTPIYREEPV